MKTIVAFGIVPASKTRVRCVICAVCIPRAERCVDQHIYGSKHDDNLQFMAENGIYFRDDALFCKACDVYLGEQESVINHIDKASHTDWWDMINEVLTRDYICFDDYLSSEAVNTAFCKVCQMELLCTREILMGHVNMVSHSKNLLEKIKPRHGIFNTENTDEVWCKVCDMFISNNAPVILDHVDRDTQHVEWYMEFEDIIQDHQISLAKYLANKFETSAYCKKCKIDVPCKIVDIICHIKTASHLYKLNEFEPL